MRRYFLILFFATVDFFAVHSQSHTITGTVTASTFFPLQKQWIYALSYSAGNSQLTVADSTKTDTNGTYTFVTKDTALYLVAKPDSTYPNEVWTYYSNAITFQTAKPILAKSGTITADWSTIGCNNLHHGDYIGGKVTTGSCNKIGSNKPVAGLRLILMWYKSNTPVKQTWTDKNGNFAFSNVGTNPVSIWTTFYRLYADFPNIDNVNNAPILTLSDTSTYHLVQDYWLCDTFLTVANSTGLDLKTDAHYCRIFPNPATKGIMIQTDGMRPSQGSISIMDLQGKIILSESRYFGKDFSSVIDLSTLPSSIYLVKIATQYETFTLKVSKI